MEKVPEELNRWFFLKVNFTEYLKIAYVEDRTGVDILWVKIVEMQKVPEEF